MILKRVVAVLLVAAVCLAPKAPALADTTSARAPVGRTIGTAAAKGAAEAVEPAAIAAFVVGSLLVIAAGVAIWHLFLHDGTKDGASAQLTTVGLADHSPLVGRRRYGPECPQWGGSVALACW